MAKHLKVLVGLALWAHMIIGVVCIMAVVISIVFGGHRTIECMAALAICFFSCAPWLALGVLADISLKLDKELRR